MIAAMKAVIAWQSDYPAWATLRPPLVSTANNCLKGESGASPAPAAILADGETDRVAVDVAALHVVDPATKPLILRGAST